MKNLAPKITRQRLVIEGFFNVRADKGAIMNFFDGITRTLNLRTYGRPVIYSSGKKGKAINHGFDAFVPLIDSGIALYLWGNAKFFSIVIYSCKKFDKKKAVKFARNFFNSKRIAYKSF